MIYTVIVSLLIEKPFYLLSPQSVSFQIVSEFIDIFVKLSNFIPYVPGVGLLTPSSVPMRAFLYTMIVPGGGFLLPSSCVPGICPGGWLWMKLIPAF